VPPWHGLFGRFVPFLAWLSRLEKRRSPVVQNASTAPPHRELRKYFQQKTVATVGHAWTVLDRCGRQATQPFSTCGRRRIILVGEAQGTTCKLSFTHAHLLVTLFIVTGSVMVCALSLGTHTEGVSAEAIRDPRKNVERLERLERLAENTALRTAQWQKCLERLERLDRLAPRKLVRISQVGEVRNSWKESRTPPIFRVC
jgi:hypothetical protein